MSRIHTRNVRVKHHLPELLAHIKGTTLERAMTRCTFMHYKGNFYVVFRTPYIGWIAPTVNRCDDLEINLYEGAENVG